MSRIDDALSRVLRSARPEPEISVAGEALHRSHDRSALDGYAREHGHAVTRAERHPITISPGALRFSASTAVRHGGWRRPSEPLEATSRGKLVVSESVGPTGVEQYRRLAGVMHEIQIERGLKTLMVTSALPGEGKTLTVANLALTLSESFRRRVLLIDADLRRPCIHQVFGLPNVIGLSDVLGSAGPDVPLLEVSPHLSVLTAGPSDGNPMAGLTSERMRLLLERAGVEFDWVLLDAAPVGLMPDARLLAGLTRAVLFVIGAGSAPYPLIARALTEIGPECVVGTVLNRVDSRNLPATAYYNHYYADTPAADS